MNKNIFSFILLGGAAWIGVQSHFEAEAQLNETIVAHRLNESDAAAFRVCVKQSHDVEIKPWEYKGRTLVAFKVPQDVCACHAPTMTKIYSPDGMKKQDALFDSLVEGLLPTPLEPVDVSQSYQSQPHNALNEIIQSIGSCVLTERRRIEKLYDGSRT